MRFRSELYFLIVLADASLKAKAARNRGIQFFKLLKDQTSNPNGVKNPQSGSRAIKNLIVNPREFEVKLWSFEFARHELVNISIF